LLLIAGGALDPHQERLRAAAARAGVPHRLLLCGPEDFPRLSYGVPDGALVLDGEPVSPTALWLRHDVFHTLADPRPEVGQRAQAWFDALVGWAALRPDVRWPNRRALARRVNKVAQLALAAAHGLRVPVTRVTNDLPSLVDGAEGLVAKPVSGGGLCCAVPELLGDLGLRGGAAPQPAFVQERLAGPELRAYVVGRRVMTWEILTDTLDHRADPAAGVRAAALPPEVEARLLQLAATMGLEFAAADFKRDPASGAPVFLEINTQPMWTAYDTASGGELVRAILALLLEVG
jgi:hypothetical protein